MRKPKVIEGSGNVFADIGLANADELLAKADLASLINQTIRNRGYTQSVAAEILGIDQPRVSALQRGRLHLFSLAKLAQFISRLGNTVEITVKQTPSVPSISVKAVTSSEVLFWQGSFAVATTATLFGKVANQADLSISAEVFSKEHAVNGQAAGFDLESLDMRTPYIGALLYARSKEFHV